jgi:hypothetical protein
MQQRRTPQVICYLGPHGEVKMQLIGASGLTRGETVTELDSIRRALQAQIGLTDPALIGEDASPTQSQIDHWENHKTPKTKKGWITLLKSSCGFCKSEAKRVLLEEELAEHDETLVKRFDSKGRKLREVTDEDF